MAQLLNDSELQRLVGTVILNGDPQNIRPNAYVLRLGAEGEFLNTKKDFNLNKTGKGIRIQPGHSVAVTALETLDFRRETVHKLFPGCDLHAFVSPTTDLSREGIVAQSTQVDAGYHGTLNWTLTNASSDERRFVFQEKIYRLTIVKLERGETPDQIYGGDYQSQTGYVRSQRAGPPVGFKDSDWIDASFKNTPEEMLENLIRSGYPWNILGERLKVIDQQFFTVTNEYAGISTTLEEMKSDVSNIRQRQDGVSNTVRQVLREEAGSLQNRWLVLSITSLVGLVGFVSMIFSNQTVVDFVKANIMWVGIGLFVLAAIILILLSRRKTPPDQS